MRRKKKKEILQRLISIKTQCQAEDPRPLEAGESISKVGLYTYQYLSIIQINLQPLPSIRCRAPWTNAATSTSLFNLSVSNVAKRENQGFLRNTRFPEAEGNLTCLI